MGLIREADGHRRLGGRGAALQEAPGTAHPRIGEPGVRRHAVGPLEGAQQREGAGAQLRGELVQGRRVRQPFLQDLPYPGRPGRARRTGCTGRQRPSVSAQQPGNGDPQHAVGGQRVACLRRPVHLLDEPRGVRILDGRLGEAGRSPERAGLRGDLGDEARGRVERGVRPAVVGSRPRGVRHLRVDHDDAPVAGPYGPVRQPDLFDPARHRAQYETLVAVPREGVAHVPGAEQIQAGQLRVPPVPRPLAGRASASAPAPPALRRAAPAASHAPILRPARRR